MKQCGFSVIELLVSLLLMSTISVSLLKYQWHIGQLLNQLSDETLIALNRENAREYAVFGMQNE